MMSYGYIKTLESDAFARYMQKLNVIGLSECPYDMPADVWENNPTKWPEVQWPDVYHYLIDTPGVFTRQSMKNHKSLEASDFFLSGWVQAVLFFPVKHSSNFVFKAAVRPSQRVNEEPHQPWVASTKDGEIIAGHCTCMAGLGESCSHVGALLFKIEAAVRNGYTRQACTDVPCKWNECFVKSVTPDPVAQIKFYKAETTERLRKSKRARKEKPTPSSPEKQQEFLQILSACSEKPVVLSLFANTCHVFDFKGEEVATKRLPVSLKSLYQEKNIKLTDTELKTKCAEISANMTATTEQLEYLVQSTLQQSNSVTWHEQRLGRVTSSVVHSVLHTKLENPSKSLLMKICHPSDKKINVPAILWGKDKEPVAFENYSEAIKVQHKDVNISKTGLHLCKDKTFIGASPDGLFSCSCCGNAVIEIKCPYKFKDSAVEDMLASSDFCLTDKYEVKQSHAYYSQVQLQMHVTDCDICHFVIWTPQTCIITTVDRNQVFIDAMLPVIEKFWTNHCLPELLTHRFQIHTAKASSATLQPADTDLFCYCQKPEDGTDMIGCDNGNCKFKWIHYTCAKIKRPPKGKWYCKECKKK